MNSLADTHLLAKLCEASGFQPPTAKSHLHKDYLIGASQPITGGADTGRKRRFPFSTIIQAAVAKQMIDLGLASARAFKAAIVFAHTGEAEDEWLGTDQKFDPAKNRPPSVPYNTGRTLLIVWDEGQAVVCQTPKTTADEIAGNVPLNAQGQRRPFLTVHCNPIFNNVARALGYHPEEILEEVYG